MNQAVLFHPFWDTVQDCGSQKCREQMKVAAVETHQQQRSALTPSAAGWKLFRPWQLNIYFLCSNYSQHKFPLGHNWVTCSGFCYLSALKSCMKCRNGSRVLKSCGELFSGLDQDLWVHVTETRHKACSPVYIDCVLADGRSVDTEKIDFFPHGHCQE